MRPILRKRLFLAAALLAVLALLPLSGCASVKTQSGQSTLWRVQVPLASPRQSSQSPASTVYLMGSIHVLPKSAYPLKPALNKAFNDSARVVFEINLADEKHDIADSFQDGLYPKGEKLSQHLSPETLTMLKTLLPYFQLSFEKFEPMRPWLVSDLLTSLYLSRSGYQSELGLDMHFYDLARCRGKPIDGLEKIQAQTEPFRQLTDREADRYLRSTLASLPYTGVWFSKMIAAWRTGNVAALDALINHSTESDKGFYKSIFDDRNAAWMPRVRSYLRAPGNTLIIVGSGHLVGRHGLVAQLRREGYSVKQL